MTPVETLLLTILLAWFGAMTVRDVLVIREARKCARLRDAYERLGIRWPPEETNRRIMDLIHMKWEEASDEAAHHHEHRSRR